MLAGPDYFQNPFPLHLLLEPAKGLFKRLIFTNFNHWHAGMLLHRAYCVKLWVRFTVLERTERREWI